MFFHAQPLDRQLLVFEELGRHADRSFLGLIKERGIRRKREERVESSEVLAAAAGESRPLCGRERDEKQSPRKE